MKWILKEAPPHDQVKALSKTINTNEFLSTILVQRGIRTFQEAKNFFRPQLEELHDPFLMKDMDKAIDRINQAIFSQEKIIIYGDYDVDGTTAVSCLYTFFSTRYEAINVYIPDRYKEGYGISFAGIDQAHKEGASLMISLDCGIKAVEQVTYAKEKGIDFIICDHHRPGPQLPPAVAILDPKQDDCTYPFDELCGCGVGFKLIQGFCLQNDIPFDEIYPLLDLVAVGTCADIVPLTGENRTLVHFGLKQLNENPRPGLLALKELYGKEKDMTVTNVVFGLSPRINAAGRIQHALGAVHLMTSTDIEEARNIAGKINNNNTERQEYDKSITEEALLMIEHSSDYQSKKSTVLYEKNWHKGVIGIVASRCIENYYRPTIILTESNGKAAGSARSVVGFDIYDAIAECADLLEQFGGHKYAAGMTMPIENIPAFQEKFEQVVTRKITADQLVPKLEIDIEIDLSYITTKFYHILNQIGPFGPKNMQPVFLAKNVVDTGYSKIVKEDHLKLDVSQNGSQMGGIAFGMAHHYDAIKTGQPFDICFTIEENHFRDNVTLQLMVKDIRTTPTKD